METQIFVKPNTKQMSIANKFLEKHFLSKEESLKEHKSRVNLNYFSKPEAILFIHEQDEIVGMAYLYKRIVQFGGIQIYAGWLGREDLLISVGGQKILSGGLGSVCVHKDQRKKGIGAKLLIEGMDKLKDWGCDIAYLAADIKSNGHFYGKVGFVPKSKPCFFYNRKGELSKAWGSMIAPVTSRKIFEEIVNSNKPLYLGYGNW